MANSVLADRITVFAPASLFNALEEVNAAFDGDVVVSYGSSAALARQILNGAPADVYISANALWMDELQKVGIVSADRRKDLLTNRLVFAGTGEAIADISEVPGRLGDGRLAVGLTMAVPAGIYARQTLEAADLWGDLQTRLAEADNVRAAAVLAARGETPLAIVYATDALAFDMLEILYEIDPELHDPILYPVSSVSDLGELYVAHLQSSVAHEIFGKHGFGIAP